MSLNWETAKTLDWNDIQQLPIESAIRLWSLLDAECADLSYRRRMVKDYIERHMEDVGAELIPDDDITVKMAQGKLVINDKLLEDELYMSPLWDQLTEAETECRTKPAAKFNGRILKEIAKRGGKFKEIIDRARSHESASISIRRKA